jgi:hypothetical protein
MARGWRARILMMPDAHTEKEVMRPPPAARPAVLRPAAVPRHRNQFLGIVLAVVAVLVFVTAIALAILFHYAETHHALPRF